MSLLKQVPTVNGYNIFHILSCEYSYGNANPAEKGSLRAKACNKSCDKDIIRGPRLKAPAF